MALSLSQSRMSLLNFESPRKQEEVQNFLYRLDSIFPKNSGLGEDFWHAVNAQIVVSEATLNTTPNTIPKTTPEKPVGLIGNVVLIKRMFNQCVGIDLEQAHFEAAYKMIGGSAVDFSSCPTSYLVVVIGACWLHLHGIKSHLLYLNDELSAYRANSFQKLFDAMEISTAVISPEMDIVQRTKTYQTSVTFCSVRELGLDYLRMNVDQAKESSSGVFVNQNLLSARFQQKELPEQLAVVLVEDVGLIMVDSMMTPLQVSSEQFSVDQLEKDTPEPAQSNDESVIAVSSFNKIFKKLPRIGGVSPSLDHHTKYDLSRYGISQHSLQPFRLTSHNKVHFFNHEKNRLAAISNEVLCIAEQVAVKKSAQICIIDQLSPELSEQFASMLSVSKHAESIKIQNVPLDEVLAFFQSNEKLPQHGIMCVVLEESLTNIPDVTEQYHRIQGVDVAVLSMGVEASLRMSRRRSASLAGIFNCSSSTSFLTVEHFNTNNGTLVASLLSKLPQKLNQWLLPKIVLVQQSYHDRQRKLSNKALLIYEQETDDLLAFTGRASDHSGCENLKRLGKI